ncbi:hypothetical protein BDV41DRAFT_573906 [Aspergillus transmontanensis]|uniref:Myb-like domain-containing protein n=1 Tax=Aspergillus transmontanensis TaxID=1034304 RepID=A0A5N6W787_9EURO|nr:hypothetical protein BDV41DRAFT_573906 [Aspergillus transmontanensis]
MAPQNSSQGRRRGRGRPPRVLSTPSPSQSNTLDAYFFHGGRGGSPQGNPSHPETGRATSARISDEQLAELLGGSSPPTWDTSGEPDVHTPLATPCPSSTPATRRPVARPRPPASSGPSGASPRRETVAARDPSDGGRPGSQRPVHSSISVPARTHGGDPDLSPPAAADTAADEGRPDRQTAAPAPAATAAVEDDRSSITTVPSVHNDSPASMRLSSEWTVMEDESFDLDAEYRRRQQRETRTLNRLVEHSQPRDIIRQRVQRQVNRVTRPWTSVEYERLVDLFNIYGPQWEEILRADQSHRDGPKFNPHRTAINLKDKMRNHKIKLLRERQEVPLELQYTKLPHNRLCSIAKRVALDRLRENLPCETQPVFIVPREAA